MLDHLEWESLEAWHAKNQPTMLFKIIYGLVGISADKYYVAASARTRYQHSLKLSPDPCLQRLYMSSAFFPLTVCRWNSQRANVIEALSLVSLDTW